MNIGNIVIGKELINKTKEWLKRSNKHVTYYCIFMSVRLPAKKEIP